MFKAMGTLIDAILCLALAIVVAMLSAPSAGRKASPKPRSRRFD